MKSRVLGALVLFFSLAAFAGSVSKVELENVNKTISMLLGGFGQYVTVEVTKAGRSNTTKLLTSANVKATIMEDMAVVNLGLKTVKEDITLNGSLEGEAAKLGMTIEDVKEQLEAMNKFIAAINKKGEYEAELATKMTAKGLNVAFTMIPSKTNKKPSVKKLEVKGMIPADTTETAKFELTGTFKGGADNVKIVKTSITNIFNDLADGGMPSEEDFSALGQVIEQMMKALEDIEEEE